MLFVSLFSAFISLKKLLLFSFCRLCIHHMSEWASMDTVRVREEAKKQRHSSEPILDREGQRHRYAEKYSQTKTEIEAEQDEEKRGQNRKRRAEKKWDSGKKVLFFQPNNAFCLFTFGRQISFNSFYICLLFSHQFLPIFSLVFITQNLCILMMMLVCVSSQN